MKVLQVHNYYAHDIGGEEAMLELEGQLLQARGHSVERFEISNDSVNPSALRTGIETIWSRRSYKELREAIRSKTPDLVHFHNTFVRLSPSVYWAAAAEGIPVVQTLHNYRLTCANGMLMRNGMPCEECVGGFPWPALVHRTYRGSLSATGAVVGMQQFNRLLGTYRNRVDAYITLTEFARSAMVRAGLPEEKVYVKPNFISDPLNGGNTTEERTNQIVFVGRVRPEKGVDLLLEAWRLIQPGGTRLVIVGDGPEREELQRRFSDLSSVEWRGWAGREEVLHELARSSYLVMPSRWYEVFPLVILEALSLGTPVIAPEHGGFPDIVSHGDNGLLFAPNSERSLSATLRHALQVDEGSWRRLSENARSAYLKRFTPETNYPLLMEIYEKAMQRAGGK